MYVLQTMLADIAESRYDKCILTLLDRRSNAVLAIRDVSALIYQHVLRERDISPIHDMFNLNIMLNRRKKQTRDITMILRLKNINTSVNEVIY